MTGNPYEPPKSRQVIVAAPFNFRTFNRSLVVFAAALCGLPLVFSMFVAAFQTSETGYWPNSAEWIGIFSTFKEKRWWVWNICVAALATLVLFPLRKMPISFVALASPFVAFIIMILIESLVGFQP
jgi:hypothetical protein